LVRHVTRILIMMGLESNTLQGVAAVSILDLMRFHILEHA
jgi:hypothetical protein